MVSKRIIGDSAHLSFKLFIIFVSSIILIQPGCRKETLDEPDTFPNLRNASERIITDDLVLPAGLSVRQSSKSGTKTDFSISGDISGILTEGPLFLCYHDNTGFYNYQNPTVSQFEGPLENLNLGPIANFNLENYYNDYDAYTYYAGPDSLWRPRGLTLDGLNLEDGSILVSSNSSDKIFIVNPSGETGIFMQNDELKSITDLILGKDGKIYAAQAAVFDENNPDNMISPKRIISIDAGIIKTEVELPTSLYYPHLSVDHIPLTSKQTPFFEKIKIVENSDTGKRKYGTKFLFRIFWKI